MITQALMDANSNSSKSEMHYERRQARAWLQGGGRDFVTVCHCADLDPAYVRQKAHEALKPSRQEVVQREMAEV